VDPLSNINGVISATESKNGTKWQEEGKKASSGDQFKLRKLRTRSSSGGRDDEGVVVRKARALAGEDSKYSTYYYGAPFQGQSANLKPFKAGASSENAENVLFVTEIGSWEWSRVTKELKELVCVETCFQGRGGLL
jgi:hypothetical protein